MSVQQSSEGNGIPIKSERPKIPIQRWGKSKINHDISSHGKVERRRVAHACEPCREKKIKCDGDRPMCHHCRTSGIGCYYGDGKKERARKHLRTLENRILDLEGLVRDIRPYLNSAGVLVVQEILSRNPAPSLSENGSSGKSPADNGISNYHLSRRHSENSLSQSCLSADINSVSPMDRQSRDLHTGFSISQEEGAERKSDSPWILSGDVKLENHGGAPASNPRITSCEIFEPDSSGIDMGISTQKIAQDLSTGDGEIPIRNREIDTLSLPDRAVAESLIDTYFTTVHPLFPIIYKPHFMMQFNRYYGSLGALLDPAAYQNSRKWLTVLNLIFAIAEKCLQSEFDMNIRDQQRDADYFAKSRILGALDDSSVFQIPDLGKIQALGLAGMYLLASIQTNRAWNVVGLAIRLANGTGLHLRGNNPPGDLEAKMRVRIWYCLYCLETTLSLITGRPSAIQDRNCSAPHPSALDDEILSARYSDHVKMRMIDTYFAMHHALMAISADMISTLYSEKSFLGTSLSQVQRLISGLSTRLKTWRIQLPLILDFFKEEHNPVFRRQRLNLAFQYHMILMLIHKQCLANAFPYQAGTPDESAEVREFNKISSELCVNSARAIIHLIVKEYRSKDLISNSPWWSLIHYLIPAKNVIILEMADRNLYNPAYKASLLNDCRMMLAWLKTMSKSNQMLQRHSLELSDQLKELLPEIEGQLEEKIVDPEPEDATPQSIPFSGAHKASPTLPQRMEFRELQIDTYERFYYDNQYQYDSTSTLVSSPPYRQNQDSIIIEPPIAMNSHPRNNPQIGSSDSWLEMQSR